MKKLSPMQLAVAMQHAGGFSTKHGAQALGISIETYKTYLKIARLKLDVRGGAIEMERGLAERYLK